MRRRGNRGAQVGRAVRKLAMSKEDVVEGIACQGTALESATFGVGKKVFLFLRIADGVHQLRLKLGDSLAEARRLAASQPRGFALGAQGWAKVTFGDDDAPSLALLERWIEESYRTVVGARTRPTSR